jgi:hypothetical protein
MNMQTLLDHLDTIYTQAMMDNQLSLALKTKEVQFKILAHQARRADFNIQEAHTAMLEQVLIDIQGTNEKIKMKL